MIKRLLLMIIGLLFLLVICLNVFALDPYFTSQINDSYIVPQGTNFFLWITGQDDDGDYPLYFDHSSSVFDSFYMLKPRYNDTATYINFTPTNEDVIDNTTNLTYYNILIILQDSATEATTKWVFFNITNVNDPPEIISFLPANTTPNVLENNSLWFNFTATDPDLIHPGFDYLSNVWYFINFTTGNESKSYEKNLTLIPGWCDEGQYNVTLIVNDSYGLTDSVNWTVNVLNNNRLPIFNGSIQNMSWQEDSNYTTNFTLSQFFFDLDEECGENLTYGAETVEVVYAINSSQEVEIIVNSTNGNVTFVPPPNWFGVEIVRFYANDSYNISYSNNVTINVTNVNDPPSIEPIPNQTAYAGINFVYKVNASDPDNDTLIFDDNSTFFDIDSATGVINFTPTNANNGTHYIKINVSDSEYTDSTVFKLVIIENNPPILDFIPNQNATQGVPFSLNVTASDPDGDNLTFSDNATFFNITQYNTTMGIIEFTPIQNDTGNHTVIITVTDWYGLSDSQEVNFTILDVNYPPVLEYIPNQTLTTGVNFYYKVNASDPDYDTLIFSDNASIFDIDPYTGVINFTPNASHEGLHPVNITVNDSEFVDYQIVWFTVSINYAPEIINYTPYSSTATVDENSSILFNVTVIDQNNDTLRYEWYLNWSIQNSTTCEWVYQPNFTAAGVYNVTVIVYDPYNASDNHSWILTVNNVNQPPVFNGPILNISWEEDVNLTDYLNLSNYFYDYDEEDTLTYGVIGNKSIYIKINNSMVSFYPNKDWFGIEIVRFYANDSYNVSYSNNVTLNVTNVNDPPVLDFIPDQWLNVGEEFILDVNATDVDNDTLYFATNDTFFKINSTTGVINITANSSKVGNYSVNISVNDSVFVDYQIVNFVVNGTNYPPEIVMIYPYGNITYEEVNITVDNETITVMREVITTIYNWSNASLWPNGTKIKVSENSSILFNITVFDADYDNLNYRWYIDGELNTTLPYLTFWLDLKDAGIKNITVVVDDTHQHYALFYWNMTVENLNRLPIFGKRVYTSYADFKDGSIFNVNLTYQLGNITLGFEIINGSLNFSLNGSYVSPVIDFGSDITTPQFVNISWKAIVPNGTNITFYTRTATSVTNLSSVEWDNVTTNSQSGLINSESKRYLQFKVDLYTTNKSISPVIEEVIIYYEIPSEVITGSYSNWIQLGYYFSDPDGDALVYDYEDISNAGILGIGITEDRVSFSPKTEGTATLRFIGNDGYNISYSNVFTLTVRLFEQPTQIPTGGGGGGGRTIVQPKTTFIEVPEPYSFELVVPEKLSMGPKDTITASILLRNTGNITLTNIYLEAESDTPDLFFTFSKDRFPQLMPNAEVRTTLTIKAVKSLFGNYLIKVSALSQDPLYKDTATISLFINATLNKTVQFVRDLLSTNPECLELNELLKEAQSLIVKGQHDEASRLLNHIIEGCRYLISVKGKLAEKPIEIEERKLIPKKLIIIGSILFLIVLLVVVYFLVRRRG